MEERRNMAEKEKKEYTPSAQTDQARQDALDHGSRKPGAYVSKWQQMLDAAMEKILNREKFSYDLNGDALYRQYKDQAVKNGRLSMLDTLGASAALTGGYGSSYGQTAAQQSYQRSMDGLTDRAAALYDRARENYDREGEQERSRYNLLKQRESSSRSAYDRELSAWEAENQRLWQRYDSLRQQDYQSYRDQIADEQWQAQFDEAQRQFNEDLRKNKKYR